MKVSDKVLADNALVVAGGNVEVEVLLKKRFDIALKVCHGDVERAKRAVSWVSDVSPVSWEIASFGGDRRLDNFGEEIVCSGKSGGILPPVLDIENSFWRSYGYELVGHGVPLNVDCDRFVRYMTCFHTELHNEHPNQVFTQLINHHCNNWRCPKCFFYGSAVREANHIEQKLTQVTKEFGMLPEAGMIQIPKCLWGASVEEMRKWVIRCLKRRGGKGGNLIFHPFRYASTKWIDGVCHMANWYYAPHFHLIIYFQEEYGRCRNCKYYNPWGSKSVRGKKNYGNHGGSACLNCSGFEGLTRRMYKEDGAIVKIFDKRESFFKTAVYELSHAGFKIGVERVQISTWWGNCKGVKVVYQPHKLVCPECHSDLGFSHYHGGFEIVKSRASPDYLSNMWFPLEEDGKLVWFEDGVIDGG